MMWTNVKLDYLCEMNSGGTPRRGVTGYYDGNIPWVKIGDIDNAIAGIITETEELITREGLRSIRGRIFPKGTLLLAMYGSVGKTAFAGVDLSTNQAILGIRIKDPTILYDKYLKFWLDSIKQKLLNRAVGGTLQNISLGIVKQLEIPLPPLNIQKQIANTLDKADELFRKDKELLQKYDDLAQSIFYEMFGDPVRNEMGWIQRSLLDCVVMKGGGTPDTSKDEYYDGEIPWVSPKDMKSLFVSSSIDKISELALKESSTKLIEQNSVLMVVRSGILKKELPLAVNVVPVAINQDMKALICKEGINSIFLLFQLKAMASNILSTVRGTTADNISSDVLKKISLIVPSLEIQNKFRDVIKNVYKQRDLSNNSIKESKLLFENLLQSYFS